MSFDGEERTRSPRDMFFFGVIQEGLRGPNGIVDAAGAFLRLEEEIDNLLHYGVDWHDMANVDLLHHHNQHNPHEMDSLEHDSTRQPPHLSLIEIPTFQCPFDTDEQLQTFSDALISLPEYDSRDMEHRNSLWMQALDLMTTILPSSQ